MQIIDLREFSIWMLMLSICKGFAIFTIIHTIYKDKFNSFITLITTLTSVTVWNIINQHIKSISENNESSIFMFLSYIALALFIFIIFAISIEAKTKTKIMGTLLIFGLYLLIWIGTSGFLSYMWYIFGYSDFIDGLPSYCSTISLTLSTAVTYLVGGYLISFFFSMFKIKSKELKSKYLYFYIFPITNILPLIIAMSSDSYLNYDKPIYQNVLIDVTFVVVSIIDFSTVFVVDAIKKTDDKNEMLLIQSAKNEFEYQNLELIKAEQEQLVRMRHDIKNINLTAKDLILSGNSGKAIEILDSSSNELDRAGDLRLCNNEIINTVFYIKSKEAKNKDIEFDISTDIQNTVKIENIDFARVLLNLCDNAINATEACGGKTIKFSIKITDKMITVDTENSFIEKSGKPEKGHGNGTKIIKQIAENHGGEYTNTKNGNIYTTHTAMRNIAIKQR